MDAPRWRERLAAWRSFAEGALRRLERLRPAALVLAPIAVALLAVLMQVLWLLADHGPPESDEWHHLTKSQVYHQAWSEGGLEALLSQLAVVRVGFPPLVHLAALPFYEALGGFSMRAAALSLAPWLLLLVLATWGIARHVAGPGTGLVAAALVAAMPMVICLSHKFLLDLTLAALVTTSLFAVVRSDTGRSAPWMLLAGACFGLALLAKFTAGVFLLGAFLYVLGARTIEALRGLRGRRWLGLLAMAGTGWAAGWIGMWCIQSLRGLLHHPARYGNRVLFGISEDGADPEILKRNLLVLAGGVLLPALLALLLRRQPARGFLNALAALFLAALVASAWYLPKGVITVGTVLSFTVEGGSGEGDPLVGTLRGWLFYPWAMGRLLPRSWFHALLIGLVATPFLKDLRGRAAPILATLLGAFLILNFSDNKEARYLVPLSGAFAVLAAVWTRRLPSLPRVLVQGTLILTALGLLTSWVAVKEGWWRAPSAVRWIDDHIGSTGNALPTGYFFPPEVGLLDVLRTPDAPVVMQLPRDMPFTEAELPLGNTGP